jgi:ADP-ribose pyrophosphatase
VHIERPKSGQPIPPDAKRVFKGVLFDVYQWEQKLFDGTTKTFEKVKRPDTVVVFPVLSDGKIIVTEQEQPGAEPFIGATGGRVDEGEDVLHAAKRELLEESGYEADHFILWHAEQPSAKTDFAVYMFIAKGLKKVADLHLDAGEKIIIKSITFDELLNLASDKRFAEKEIIPQLFEARINPAKKEELRKLFNPVF